MIGTEDQARDVIRALEARGRKLITVESCTGGLLAAALTATPGSSAVFDRGFVTYSNESKSELVGVPAELIAAHGAVSQEVARAMAEGESPARRPISPSPSPGSPGRAARSTSPKGWSAFMR